MLNINLPVNIRDHQIQRPHDRHQIPDLMSPRHMIQRRKIREPRAPELDPVRRRPPLTDDINPEFPPPRPPPAPSPPGNRTPPSATSAPPLSSPGNPPPEYDRSTVL